LNFIDALIKAEIASSSGDKSIFFQGWVLWLVI